MSGSSNIALPEAVASQPRTLAKATIGGFRPDGEPIWVWVDYALTRSGDGWIETPVKSPDRDRNTVGETK